MAAGGSGLSILVTSIYFLTRHISEVQYNNWGNGVWNSLLTIQGTGDCNTTENKTSEDYKKCISDDISTYYDLKDVWNNNYWKTYYDGKLKNNDDKNKFQKLGSWEKFREVCAKAFDELIKKQNWNQLSTAIAANSANSAQSTHINSQDTNGINYADCLKAKSTTK